MVMKIINCDTAVLNLRLLISSETFLWSGAKFNVLYSRNYIQYFWFYHEKAPHLL